MLVVAPRLVAPLLRDADRPLPPAAAWADTSIELPEGWPEGPLVDELAGAQRTPPVRASRAVRSARRAAGRPADAHGFRRLRRHPMGARGRSRTCKRRADLPGP